MYIWLKVFARHSAMPLGSLTVDPVRICHFRGKKEIEFLVLIRPHQHHYLSSQSPTHVFTPIFCCQVRSSYPFRAKEEVWCWLYLCAPASLPGLAFFAHVCWTHPCLLPNHIRHIYPFRDSSGAQEEACV